MSEVQIPETFTVDGVQYLTTSLTDKGKEILTSLDVIGRQMQELQAKFKIAEIARTAVGQELAAEVSNFVKAETDEPEAE